MENPLATSNPFDAGFWTQRYREGRTGWNIGYPSTPIKEYIDQLEDRHLKILIPGAGNAYEAEYLHEQGFKYVFVLDISEVPLKALQERIPDFPEEHLLHEDFFKHEGMYDLILEQTFFCALHPSLRRAYAEKMFRLLKPGGKLAGLWFSFPMEDGQNMPPFGGHIDEYRKYLTAFEERLFDTCRNSIEPRTGRELFGIFQKPE